MSKKLYKSSKNKMISGVCGGIAEYFNIDPTIVRLVTGVLCCLKGVGVVLYILACIIIPYSDSDDDIDNLKSANVNSDSKKNEGESNGKMHSDEEFDNFFKK